MAKDKMGWSKIEVFPVKVMKKVAAFHVPAFRKRVKRGLDAKGRTFKPYDPSYVEYKASRFRSKRTGKRIESMAEKHIKSTRMHPPDLMVTGDMMMNLKRKKQAKDYYIIGFNGEEAARVGYNKNMGRDIVSDIPNSEKAIITKLLANEMEKQFKRKLKNVTITIGN